MLAAVSALTALAAQHRAMPSHVVRLRLAGATLNPKQSEYHEYDALQRYHLVAGNHFNADGAGNAYLLLCPDLKRQPDLSDTLAGIALERGALPQLRAGTGVNIGDTPQQMQHKTGTVAKVIAYYPKTQMRVYRYTTRLTLDSSVPGARAQVKYVYKADYTFFKGRLWSILYMIQYPES